MFETADQLNRGGGYACSFWSVLAQAIFVPVVSFVFTLPIGALLESSGPYPAEIHHPFARVGMPPISWLAGYLLGRCASRVLPAFARRGRWAWVLSTLFFILGFLLSVRNYGIVSGFVSMFDVEGKEALGVVLVSLPAFF